MVPTALGIGLVDLFDKDDRISPDTRIESPALLAHPSIRSQMEEEAKQIAMGTFDKDYCLEKNLDWFEERYRELESSLNRKRVKEFGKGLSAIKDYLNYWRSLGAFEPKSENPLSRKGAGSNKNKAGRKADKSAAKKTSSPDKNRKGPRGGGTRAQKINKNARVQTTKKNTRKQNTTVQKTNRKKKNRSKKKKEEAVVP